MFAAATGWSVEPLVVAMAGAGRAPLHFVIVYTAGLGASWLAYLAVRHRRVAFQREMWSGGYPDTYHPCRSSRYSACFGTGTVRLGDQVCRRSSSDDPLESMAYSVRGPAETSGQQSEVQCIGGTGLCVDMRGAGGGRSGDAIGDVTMGVSDLPTLAVGLALCVATVVSGAAMVCRFAAGDMLFASLSTTPPKADMHRTEVACQTIIAVAVTVVTLLGYGIGLAVVDGALPVVAVEYTFAELALIVVGGVVAGSGSIAWRWANVITPSLTVNAITYVAPILSLAWLTLFGYVHVAHPTRLAFGTVIVLGVNVMFIRQVRSNYLGGSKDVACISDEAHGGGVTPHHMRQKRLPPTPTVE